MRLLFSLALAACLILRVLQCGFEDLLNVPDLSFTFLFVVEIFVVTANHVRQQLHIVRGDDNIANFLLGLHLTLVEKACLLLTSDYIAANRFSHPFIVVIFKLICLLDQLFIFLARLERVLRVALLDHFELILEV